MVNIVPDATTRTDVGFWDSLGMDEGGLPIHLPMGVNAKGQGPADVHGQVAHHFICWCGQSGCPLTIALAQSRRSALRSIKISVGTDAQ